MTSTEKLIEATLNRLGVRIEQSFITSATKLSKIAKVAPKKLQDEWELFQEEVIEEVNRLEKESTTQENNEDKETHDSEIKGPQAKIKHIRTKVAELNRKLEANK